MLLGSVVLSVAYLSFDPSQVSSHRYVYQEAAILANLSVVFFVLAVLGWLWDGSLLLRRRLKPATCAAFAASAYSAEGRARGQGFVDEYDSFSDPAWRRAALGWLFLGHVAAAHRWALGHYVHATFHCLVIAFGVALNIGSTAGDLNAAFLLCNLIGW